MSGDGLAEAELAVSKKDDQQPLGTTSVSCPKEEKKEMHRIEVHVVGEDAQPLGDIAVVLRKQTGEQLKQITDDSGRCAFNGLDNAAYQLSLAELDRDAWQEVKQDSLPIPTSQNAAAKWQPPVNSEQAEAFTHTIVQGECVGKIADRYGFSPQTVWHYPDNAELRKLRHDNLHILLPGDQVIIPPKSLKRIEVSSGNKITLMRLGVPERLHIRFLNYNESPRTGVPYLLIVEAQEVGVIPMIQGVTDMGGFVSQPIPPSATSAEIILRPEKNPEMHAFDLGHMHPIDTMSGLLERLRNLGYDSTQRDGCVEENSRVVIQLFQQHKNLQQTGELDATTREVIEKLALF